MSISMARVTKKDHPTSLPKPSGNFARKSLPQKQTCGIHFLFNIKAWIISDVILRIVLKNHACQYNAIKNKYIFAQPLHGLKCSTLTFYRSLRVLTSYRCPNCSTVRTFHLFIFALLRFARNPENKIKHKAGAVNTVV